MLSLSDIQAFYPKEQQFDARFLMREYLQCKILEIVFSSPFAAKLCFIGGTCLRLIHQNTRFSEDLDFDYFELTDTDFSQLAKHIDQELTLQGFIVEMREVRKGAWHCYLRFPELLYQIGLSGYKEEKILIQLDAEDQGYQFTPESRLLNRFDVFSTLLVPPLPLLLSHKITAILRRPRNKGRDFFDVTFLQAKTKPDYKFLQEKLQIQNSDQLKEILIEHCLKLDMKDMAKDVQPFLFNARDVKRVELFIEFVKSASW
jgi:predicted nucleotidyltransferase component of viral defense system